MAVLPGSDSAVGFFLFKREFLFFFPQVVHAQNGGFNPREVSMQSVGFLRWLWMAWTKLELN